MPIVYGFDVGISGFAAVIRKDNEFVWARSFVLPEDFASTQKAAQKRRLSRTRKAHRAREWWWNQQALAMGIAPLKEIRHEGGDYRTTSVDPRLLREFPQKGDETVYTSCLLRCKIVMDGVDDLEPWQIYKAVHSAIQKRGYDINIPWKAKSSKRKGTEGGDEDESERVSEFRKFIQRAGITEHQQLPCFFEAFQMGLWTPSQGIVGVRQNCTAQHGGVSPGKGFTAPREMVEKELCILLEAIQKKYPNIDANYVLWGPGKVPYASHPKSAGKAECGNLKPGSESDWNSLLGQKIPRFDNRIISKCVLMPRYGVCKAEDALYREFHFAKSLHNLRVIKDGETSGRKINFEEFSNLHKKFSEKGSATANQLAKVFAIMGIRFEGNPYDIEKPKEGGRCSFCRPALRIFNEMLLSGKSPQEMMADLKGRARAKGHDVTIGQNSESTKGLVLADLNWLKKIDHLGWEGIYIPQERYDAALLAPTKDEGIGQAMANLNNPVVRHRLHLFIRTLREMNQFLKKQYQCNEPNQIAIEFIRDDFLSKEAKRELQKFQNARREENDKAKQEAAELGLEGFRAQRKYKLWKRQGGKDPYSHQVAIGQTEIEDCEVDHIVPIENGGPDAEYNVVLTRRTRNQDKGVRTPHTWLSGNPSEWAQYTTHILSMDGLSHKTKKLLLSDNATELVERYQGLAETAWIARLASTIVRIEMGWQQSHQEGAKRIQAVSGSLTARVRRENGLNRILSGGSENKKNRTDIRHHVLDAMVISFCKDWARDPAKSRYFSLPSGVDVETFAKVLAVHRPLEIPKASELEENFYGLSKDGKLFFRKYAIRDLAYKQVGPGKVKFDSESLKKNITKIEKFNFHRELVHALQAIEVKVNADLDNPEVVWNTSIEGLELKNGSHPRRVCLYAEKPEEAFPQPPKALNGIQVLKPKGSHQGFVVCRDPNGKKKTWQAQPIYCWQNKGAVIQDLRKKEFEVRFFIRSGEYVELKKACGDISPGIFKVKTIKNGQQFVLADLNGSEQENRKNINSLVVDGDIQRVEYSTGSLI